MTVALSLPDSGGVVETDRPSGSPDRGPSDTRASLCAVGFSKGVPHGPDRLEALGRPPTAGFER
jgi:hypothetical protein